MADFFDDELLQSFMSTFYDYGNYVAPYWFIGMEEGGGNERGQLGLGFDSTPVQLSVNPFTGQLFLPSVQTEQ